MGPFYEKNMPSQIVSMTYFLSRKIKVISMVTSKWDTDNQFRSHLSNHPASCSTGMLISEMAWGTDDDDTDIFEVSPRSTTKIERYLSRDTFNIHDAEWKWYCPPERHNWERGTGVNTPSLDPIIKTSMEEFGYLCLCLRGLEIRGKKSGEGSVDFKKIIQSL